MTYQIDQAYGKQPREYMRKTFDRDAIERDIRQAVDEDLPWAMGEAGGA